MPLSINNNLDSLVISKHLAKTENSLQNSMTKIASGQRINQAADDAAGMSIMETMQAELRSLNRASRNVMDGMSMARTAESSLDSVGGQLSRMRELALQSANGGLSDQDRANIQTEFNELQNGIDQIAKTTDFNGIQLSDGSATAPVEIQVGTGSTAADTVTLDLQDVRSATLGVDAASIDVSTQTSAQDSLAAIDSAIDAVNEGRSQYGASQRTLASAGENLSTQSQSMNEARSRIGDTDVASAITNKALAEIRNQFGIAMMAQANINPSTTLSLLG